MYRDISLSMCVTPDRLTNLPGFGGIQIRNLWFVSSTLLPTVLREAKSVPMNDISELTSFFDIYMFLVL
jgi:hypothetical protein